MEVSDLDAMIGPDFGKGFNMLRPLVEKAVADRVAAEEKKNAEAAARAAQEAATDVAAADGQPPDDKPN